MQTVVGTLLRIPALLAGLALSIQAIPALAGGTLPGLPGNSSSVDGITFSPDRQTLNLRVYCWDEHLKPVKLVTTWTHRIDVWDINHIFNPVPDYTGEIPLGWVHSSFSDGEVNSWDTPDRSFKPFPSGTTLLVRFPGDGTCPAGWGHIDT